MTAEEEAAPAFTPEADAFLDSISPEEEALLVVQGHWVRVDAEMASGILPLAEDGNEWAHTAVCAVAGALTENEERLPLDIQQYVVNRAKIGLRRRRGGSEHDNFIRNIVIVCAIKQLSRRGLSPTRNVTTDGESACSIVSAALARVGVSMSESAVAKVWENHVRDVREFG